MSREVAEASALHEILAIIAASAGVGGTSCAIWPGVTSP